MPQDGHQEWREARDAVDCISLCAGLEKCRPYHKAIPPATASFVIKQFGVPGKKRAARSSCDRDSGASVSGSEWSFTNAKGSAGGLVLTLNSLRKFAAP